MNQVTWRRGTLSLEARLRSGVRLLPTIRGS